MNGPNGAELSWDCPGAGTWTWDRSHFPLPLTAIYADLHGAATEGFTSAFAEYGIPARTYAERGVHGVPYARVLPLVAPESNRKPPPAGVLRLVMRLHPEFRKRAANARRVMAEQPWRDALRRWREEDGPDWVRANAALQAEDLAGMDDRSLAEYIRRVHAHAAKACIVHFTLTGPELIPIGLLILAGREHGLSDTDILVALAGTSPSTRTPDLSGRPWQLVTGYDLDALSVSELSEVMGRAATRVGDPSPGATPDDVLGQVVVPSSRAVLTELLEVAASAYALREENGPVLMQWPIGLLRRALLEVGRRAGVGAVAVEATMAEILDYLEGGGVLEGEELLGRAARRRHVAAEAPVSLGVAEPPAPTALMPAAQARITDAILAAKAALFDRTVTGTLSGTGVGTVAYRGTARVALQVEDALLTSHTTTSGWSCIRTY